MVKMPSIVSADRRDDARGPDAARPGRIAKTTQLHAVNVAATPATAAKKKPNAKPFCANVVLSASGSPTVRPATSRPKPSTSGAFQKPAMRTAAATAETAYHARC